jgi:hypothetical protein
MFSWLKKKPVKQLKQGRKHVINDELWTFVNNYIPGHDGDCDIAEKTIRLQEGVPEKRRLEITMHECLHSFCWLLSEESVTRFAEELSTILVEEGLTNEETSKK